MMTSLVTMTGTVLITFFAPNDVALLIGAFLCAIPWGVFATQGPAYGMFNVSPLQYCPRSRVLETCLQSNVWPIQLHSSQEKLRLSEYS